MKFPENLRYTKDHEWARLDQNQVTVGITDHAQSSLGDVVFVDLPTKGRILKRGETFGVVESIKAVSDLYAPISGKVVDANASLHEDPSQINKDPYGKAWLVRIEVSEPKQLDELMDASAYSKYVASLS